MVEKRRQAKINKSSAKKSKKLAGRKASEKSAAGKSTGKASPSVLDSGSEDEFMGMAGESEDVRAYGGNGASGSAEPKGFWRQAQRLKWEKFPWVEGKKITIKTQVSVTSCQPHTYVAFSSVLHHHMRLPLLCLLVPAYRRQRPRFPSCRQNWGGAASGGFGLFWREGADAAEVSNCLSVCLSVCLSACLPVCLSVCLTVCLPV